MSTDWKSIVKSVAPTLGTLLGGPLVGTAVKVLGDHLLGNPDATEAEVQKAVERGLPPETVVKLAEIDAQVKAQMQAANFDLKRLEADTEKAYLSDTQDARKANAGNRGTFWMGVCILVIFAIIMAAVLIGCFRVLTKGMPIQDPGTVAVVFTLIGTIIGVVGSQAQTVVNFEFGTSRGGSERASAMAEAVKNVVQTKTT